MYTLNAMSWNNAVNIPVLAWALCFLLMPLLIVSCKTRKVASPVAASPVKAPANFRVVGYLLSGEIANGKASHFDVSKLTYLNIFFNGTDTTGKFKHLPHLDSTIAAAHKNHDSFGNYWQCYKHEVYY